MSVKGHFRCHHFCLATISRKLIVVKIGCLHHPQPPPKFYLVPGSYITLVQFYCLSIVFIIIVEWTIWNVKVYSNFNFPYYNTKLYDVFSASLRILYNLILNPWVLNVRRHDDITLYIYVATLTGPHLYVLTIAWFIPIVLQYFVWSIFFYDQYYCMSFYQF